MADFINSVDFGELFNTLKPGIIALSILVFGIIFAKIASSVFYKSLNKANFISTGLHRVGVEVDMGTLAQIVSKITFFIVLLFVLIAFFDKLGLESVNEPIDGFLLNVLPGALSALGLGIIAWIIATFTKFLIIKGGDTLGIDEKLGEQIEGGAGIIETTANILYWFIILFFVPAILGALGQEELLKPITDIINEITGYIPNIIAAGAIFIIGWFIAKIIKKITTSLLISVGADKATKKIGLKDFSISKISGTLVYVIILIPILIESLNKLQIDAISGPATQMLNTIMSSVPGIIAAIAIIAISYIIAKFVSKLITDLLHGVGFDKILDLIGLNNVESNTNPSHVVGVLAFAYILLLAVLEAANKLGFDNLSAIVKNFILFATNILVGVIIFGIGMYLANLASKAINSTSKSKVLPIIAKSAIIVLTAAMGLKQMGIADDIINMTFGLILGSLAIGAALAIGLGAKDVAGEEVKELIKKIKK